MLTRLGVDRVKPTDMVGAVVVKQDGGRVVERALVNLVDYSACL